MDPKRRTHETRLALPREVLDQVNEQAAKRKLSRSHFLAALIESALNLRIPLHGIEDLGRGATIIQAPGRLLVLAPPDERFLAGVKSLEGRQDKEGRWVFALSQLDEVRTMCHQAFGAKTPAAPLQSTTEWQPPEGVQIGVVGNDLRVVTPRHESFRVGIRGLGGEWSSDIGRWILRPDQRAAVERLIDQHFR